MKNLKIPLIEHNSLAITQAQATEYKAKIPIIKASHNNVRYNTQSFIFIKDWFSQL